MIRDTQTKSTKRQVVLLQFLTQIIELQNGNKLIVTTDVVLEPRTVENATCQLRCILVPVLQLLCQKGTHLQPACNRLIY